MPRTAQSMLTNWRTFTRPASGHQALSHRWRTLRAIYATGDLPVAESFLCACQTGIFRPSHAGEAAIEIFTEFRATVLAERGEWRKYRARRLDQYRTSRQRALLPVTRAVVYLQRCGHITSTHREIAYRFPPPRINLAITISASVAPRFAHQSARPNCSLRNHCWQ